MLQAPQVAQGSVPFEQVCRRQEVYACLPPPSPCLLFAPELCAMSTAEEEKAAAATRVVAAVLRNRKTIPVGAIAG